MASRFSVAGVEESSYGSVRIDSWMIERTPLANGGGNAGEASMATPTRRRRAKLQTDCKRPACNGPSGAVTPCHMATPEGARHGLVWPPPTPGVRVLGKLITQRSQVQILSPRRRLKPQVRDLRLLSRAQEVGPIRARLQTDCKQRKPSSPWERAGLGEDGSSLGITTPPADPGPPTPRRDLCGSRLARAHRGSRDQPCPLIFVVKRNLHDDGVIGR
jgi:hypothetical protein